MSELVAMAAATTVARGVAKGVLYFNAWRRGDPAVAVAANSDTALDKQLLSISEQLILLEKNSTRQWITQGQQNT